MARYDYRPETATRSQVFRQNTGQDPARYLVPDANLYHKRPSLQSGDKTFVWPVGPEGVRQAGNATVAIHHYIGDDDVEVQVIHKDESRIELSGTFPGIKGVDSMAALRLVIRDDPPQIGKILFMPGIFERVQYVTVESYDFQHSADDRTHSWDYTVTLIRTGAGRRIADPSGRPAPPNPGRRVAPRGKPSRFVTVKAGLRTLRQIAKKVYGNQNKWKLLADKNMRLIVDAKLNAQDAGLAYFDIPSHRWPLGTHIYY